MNIADIAAIRNALVEAYDTITHGIDYGWTNDGQKVREQFDRLAHRIGGALDLTGTREHDGNPAPVVLRRPSPGMAPLADLDGDVPNRLLRFMPGGADALTPDDIELLDGELRHGLAELFLDTVERESLSRMVGYGLVDRCSDTLNRATYVATLDGRAVADHYPPVIRPGTAVYVGGLPHGTMLVGTIYTHAEYVAWATWAYETGVPAYTTTGPLTWARFAI